jgi:hypothetical protein
MRRIFLAAAVTAIAATAHPQFEVASIKPSTLENGQLMSRLGVINPTN